jgi:hypothetical protein
LIRETVNVSDGGVQDSMRPESPTAVHALGDMHEIAFNRLS